MYRRLNINSRNPWLGDRFYGLARLIGVFVGIVVLSSIGSAVAEEIDIPAIVTGWMNDSSGSLPKIYRWVYILLKIIRFILSKVLNLNVGDMPGLTRWIYSSLAFFHFSQRYYLLITIAFASVYYLAARYIKNLHGLERMRPAFRYLNALVFGLAYPRLEIDDGQKQLTGSQINLIDKIGGPGYLVVQPGNLVVLEDLQGAPRICAEGLSFITRFERIREMINLDDQQSFIETIDFTTKDGIRMRVNDVHYAYRLHTGRNSNEVERQDVDHPYLFSYQAVLDRVYARSVGMAGITPWDYMVRIALDGTITDYMRARNFDDVATPSYDKKETRIQIAKELNSPGLRNRLRGVGAELLWVDMGHFEVLDKRIDDQRVRTWGSKWRGEAEVHRSFGEAKRLSYQEIGRAEAQAEMLLSIMEAFNESKVLDGLSDEMRQRRVREIILARTVQFLDSMAAQTRHTTMPGGRELPPPR